MTKAACGFVLSLFLGISAQAASLQCKVYDASLHNEKTESVELGGSSTEDRVYVQLNGYECEGAARKSLDGSNFVIHRLTFMVKEQRIISVTPEKYKSLIFSNATGDDATCSCELRQ